MISKNIVLYERYDGVRFVLDRSLSSYKDSITIFSSHWKKEVKQMIAQNHVDLLITELSRVEPDGLEISRYARKINPKLKIIWITVLGCDIFREQKKRLGNIQCLEKPLEINDFRNNVLKTLEYPLKQER